MSADILDGLRRYLSGDQTEIMSREHVKRVIAEIERLKSELAAERKQRAVAREDTLELDKAYLKSRDELAAVRDEIDRLRGEVSVFVDAAILLNTDNARLRAALKPFAKAADDFADHWLNCEDQWNEGGHGIDVGALRRARAAYNGEGST